METQLLSIVSRSCFESPSIPSGTPALCALPFFSLFFVLLCDWLVQSVAWTLGQPVQLEASRSFAAQSDCRAAACGSMLGFCFRFCAFVCFCAFVATAVVVKERFVYFHECVTLPAVAPWCPEVLSLWGQFWKLRVRKLHQSSDPPATVFFNHWAAKNDPISLNWSKKQYCIHLWDDCAFKWMWGYQFCGHSNRPRCHLEVNGETILSLFGWNFFNDIFGWWIFFTGFFNVK